MNKIVRAKLIETARKRNGFIQYQELSNKCGLKLSLQDIPQHRTEIGNILAEISEFEHAGERPLLSALVLNASGEIGDGFYRLCEKLGFGSARALKRDATFAPMQMNKCYEFWQNDSNYLRFKDI